MIKQGVIALIAGLAATPVWAELRPDYQIHGFAAQGFVLTKGNNLFGDSLDGSFDLREMGLNAQWQPLTNLGISGQLLSRRAGAADDGEPRVDFLFADLALQRMATDGHELGLRLGRVKNPFGLFNETRDVVFARPSILLPQSIYYDGEGLRSLLFSVDGVQGYGQFDHGAHFTQLTFNYALNFTLSQDEKRELFGGASPPGDVRISRYSVTRVMTDWQAGVFRTAMTLLTARLDLALQGAPPQMFDASIALLSARWNRARLSLFGEYSLVTFSGDTTTRSDGGYLQTEYRFTPGLTGFARVGARFLDRNDRDGSAFARATGQPAHMRYSRSLATGLRWQFDSHWGISGEWHAINGSGTVPALDNQNRDRASPWNALLIMAGYRF
ncbi:MAG: TonB-dependent receptor [Pseudomonadota bacterium]|nr:TonB-dependent receptor [Pseudomonadota bacterium]